MSLRILVLAPEPFYVQRGTPMAVRMLLESLRAAGHSCDILALAGGADAAIDGVRLFRAPALPGTRDIPPGFSIRKLLADAGMFPVAVWRMARTRYDLVVAVEEAVFMALVLKALFRTPYLYDVDSSLPEQIADKFAPPTWVRRAMIRCERRAVRGSIGAMVCCKALGDLVRAYDPNLPVQVLEDVPLPGAGLRAEPPADCVFDEPVVMYVGNLEAYQGVDLLIDGFARAVASGTRARLVVIGGDEAGIREHRARAERAGVGGLVSFLGPRPVDEIGRYLGQATIVASPRRQGRNTPMKIYTYLASGRALLATRLATHTQVLDAETAMLVEPEAEDMGRGIAALLGDGALRARLAETAAGRAQTEFSPTAYRRKLEAFLAREIAPRLRRSRRGAAC